MALNPKQAMFVAEYLIDLNATQAAIRAGYSARTANEQGSRLLADAKVRAAVEAAQAERGARVQATGDDVLREISRLAMFDPAQFKDVKTLEDMASLPEDARRAIVGWFWDKDGRLVLKLAKESSLNMLARHHGLFERDNKQKGEAEAGALAALLSGMQKSSLPVVDDPA